MLHDSLSRIIDPGICRVLDVQSSGLGIEVAPPPKNRKRGFMWGWIDI
jgi:hypothetical protein